MAVRLDDILHEDHIYITGHDLVSYMQTWGVTEYM